MKTLKIVLVAATALTLTGCPQAAKTAADGASAVKCVTANWGKTPLDVAVACFQSEEQLAVDAIADVEFLLQQNGSKPTAAYLTEARVTQKVLMKKAAASDAGIK